ncbi:MAG TPA: 4-hydroxy-tetrahydrodipicolinate synthase [Atribacteraceae bacterium]|nr:4-hydroxy-tetrahydrodipicolinate synthase [Atribacteraceae bacterium]
MRPEFGYLLTAVVTPFDARLAVNFGVFRKLVRELVDRGSDGIVIAGTTGESPTLSHKEKLRLIEVALEEVGDVARVVGGTCSYNTSESIELSREAEKIGVHGILGVAPYYNKPPQEGLYQHFRAIADSVKIPLMLYNIPGRSGVNIEPETVKRLSEILNITSIKEASGSIDQLSRLAGSLPPGFSIYSGDDNMTYPTLAMGGVGVVSVASHIAGEEIKRMIEAFHANDIKEARSIHLRLYPLFKALFLTTNPIPLKAALKLRGWDVGEVRPPLCPLEDNQKTQLIGVLRKLGFLL